jgi:hypothetical protein
VQPAANAGAIFHDNIHKGKFHGIIWPTTPTGYFVVYEKKGPYEVKVCPLILSIQPA